LEGRLKMHKTFLNMVIHEIKHPIEALKFLHKVQKENQQKVVDELALLEEKLTEFGELDTEERPILPIGVQNPNSSHLLGKTSMDPKEHLNMKISQIFEHLSADEEFDEQYLIRVTNPKKQGFRLLAKRVSSDFEQDLAKKAELIRECFVLV
jgi:hypothetical protein